MPKWHQWISEDYDELVDDYQVFKKIPRKYKSLDEKQTSKKKDNLRVPRADKE